MTPFLPWVSALSRARLPVARGTTLLFPPILVWSKLTAYLLRKICGSLLPQAWCKIVQICSNSLRGTNGPETQLLVLRLRLVNPLVVLLPVARKTTGIPAKAWSRPTREKLLLLGSTILKITKLGPLPLVATTVLPIAVVASIALKLVLSKTLDITPSKLGLLLISKSPP